MNLTFMRKLQILLCLLIGVSTASLAQAVKTVIINVPSVQCQECKERIEKQLSHEDGVNKAVVDYKKKTCKITYIADRTNPENLKAAIANAGYDADDVTADTDAYKRLPTCCKKPEDGGGHTKTN
ncbi:MAG: cation transporter [Puia sp.]|nr:cation transporter [Puia sp.]